jgi:uncharacterized membrane protein YfcA
MPREMLRLAAIGTLAGMFSGLFGVGGGAIIVPLLILWLGYDERVATGTSLAAIAVLAIWAGTAHGLIGTIDVSKGLLVGIPAVGGVLVGTALQQRLPTRVIAGMFAVLMMASAVALIL